MVVFETDQSDGGGEEEEEERTRTTRELIGSPYLQQ
jgi:hypothetical protein